MRETQGRQDDIANCYQKQKRAEEREEPSKIQERREERAEPKRSQEKAEDRAELSRTQRRVGDRADCSRKQNKVEERAKQSRTLEKAEDKASWFLQMKRRSAWYRLGLGRRWFLLKRRGGEMPTSVPPLLRILDMRSPKAEHVRCTNAR